MYHAKGEDGFQNFFKNATYTYKKETKTLERLDIGSHMHKQKQSVKIIVISCMLEMFSGCLVMRKDPNSSSHPQAHKN